MLPTNADIIDMLCLASTCNYIIFAIANEGLAEKTTEEYYPCCGKSICAGCIHSFRESGNSDRCPFCNAERMGKTDEVMVEKVMKRVKANDAASIYMLAGSYYRGIHGFQRDHTKAIEFYVRAIDLGYSKAHNNLAGIYQGVGDLKKAKFHLEAAAIAGDKAARYTLGCIEYKSGNIERGFKHWTIAASAGHYEAMNTLIKFFEIGDVSRDVIDSTLTAYNSSCAEFRSEARDACIRAMLDTD